MLGQELRDPYGVDGAADGLGLLPIETTFEREKITRGATFRFGSELSTPWAPLAHSAVSGYEIRHGHSGPVPAPGVTDPEGLGWVAGSVLGVTVHGVLESEDVMRALFGCVPAYSLDVAIDRLTDVVMANLDPRLIDGLAGLRARQDFRARACTCRNVRS